MATESITEGVIDPIGVPATVDSVYQNTTVKYDVAVGGLPFFLAASDKYPYHRETASYKRQQLDLTQAPGEQTFEGWWLRSQSSWHLGAGINYLEPLQGNDVVYRFNKSVGIDPWTPGELTLLRDTDKVKTLSGNGDVMGAIYSSSGTDYSCVFVYDNQYLYRILDDGTTQATIAYYGGGSNPGNAIQSMTNDGKNYYVVTSAGIYSGPLDNSSNGALLSLTSGPSSFTDCVIAWAKQRLMLATGQEIWEIVGSTCTKNYTNPVSTWKFTGIAEGPAAIYFSGFSGLNSAIIKLELDNAGVITSLTKSGVAADFPYEEHVTSISVYLNKFVLIGTNKGVRVGLIDSSAYGGGYITYGPLTYTYASTNHISRFAFRDRFAYATTSNDIDGMSGLVRIDLSQQLSDGRFAWTYDLNAGVSGLVEGVAPIGESGRMAFAITGSGIYFEHATRKVTSGYIDTGYLRYNTMEKKHFKTVKVRPMLPMDAPIAVSVITKSGAVNSLITLANDEQADNDISTKLTDSQEVLAFRFTLYRSTTDTTAGAGMVGYQVKALPANKRTRSISVPLMCYDFESDRFNVTSGYEGAAWDKLSKLEDLESLGNTVTVQDFTTGEQVEGLIEKVTFDRMSPPDRRFQGFGGIVYVQVRTI